MIQTVGYAAFDATSDLKPYTFERRNVGEQDVQIDIRYCGVCHTDLHSVRNDWNNATYPLVPGHEIVGTVKSIGTKVKKYKVGDTVGVGCIVNSCGHCVSCEQDCEQYCTKGFTGTYNSIDADGARTQGGYSDQIIVNENYVLSIPANLPLNKAAPLLCAGITTFSPLKHWKIGRGHKVGIVGLGGLGHMGVKLAHSLGAQVVVFTTSPNKKDSALKLGADSVVISKNPAGMQQQAKSFDFILDTVSAPHDLPSFLNLLKNDGTLCMVGASPESHAVPSRALIWGRKSISGSLIGGIAETQQMLDYCGKHNITCDIELISMHQINVAYERLLKNDVKYRFVIDMQSLEKY